jgi:hypoxanthine-DNA glycosylase
VFKGKCEFNAAKELFEPYLYMRPIGASSMSGGSKKEVEKTKNKKVSPSDMDHSSRSLPCKPLFGSIPKVLLVGDTASPLPSNVEYSYCERSMWIVLGRMIGMDYKPIKNIDTATNEELKYFVDLTSKIIEKGICIWDVCSDVHEIGEKKSKKRRKVKSTNANDIQNFLGKNPTIDQICFIGKKAKNSFTNYFPEDNKKLKLTVLPSSSPANSRITVDEKAKQWKDAFRISGVTI